MSEITNNNSKRIDELADFSRRLINGENGRMLIEKHKKVIDSVTPMEAMQVIDIMISEGIAIERVKASVGKIINVFFKSLSVFQWEKPAEGHFLYFLMQENREAQKIMTELKSITRKFFNGKDQDIPELIQKLRLIVGKLKNYELHYLKNENLLFPYIEKIFPEYRCLQIMWSFHDDFRKSLKALGLILQSELPDRELLNREIGKLFFVVLPIVFREEQIVFPVAFRAIPEKGWGEMMDQSYETGWCFIEKPDRKYNKSQEPYNLNGRVNLGSGFLTADQLILLLNSLTVDVTFIDENDEVQYFSCGKERIFPRSNAIISRKVQNCHPPESVHVVNEIIIAFRKGLKDHADFWIQMRDRFILIRYFALRDEQGEYKGTIEVSQDVTDIRLLQEERRLLEWND